MRRLIATGIGLICLSALPLVPLAGALPQEADFQPVEASSVSGITAPFQSVATGVVVLDVLVSDRGKVRDIQVRNSLASVTDSTVNSVKGWTFKPAMLARMPVASSITVAAVFNPQCLFLPVSKAVTLQPQTPAGTASDFQPAGVISANVPPCPYGAALLSASVVVQASIDASGHLTGTKALRDVPPFTAPAAQSLKGWSFAPARLNGSPAASKVIVAFYFRQPARIP